MSSGRPLDRLAAWRGWPGPARWGWLCVRPLLGLAAIVAVLASGATVWAVIGVVAIAVCCMQAVRRSWIALLGASLAVLVSPLAAALLVARVCVSEAVLIGLGGSISAAGRPAGLRAIAAARRDAVAMFFEVRVSGVEEARGAFEAAVSTGEEDAILDAAGRYAIVAWAGWRWRELAALARRVVRGMRRGSWSDPGVEREMLWLSLFEEGTTGAMRWGVMLAAAVTAFFAFPPGSGPLLDGGAFGRLATAGATLFVGLLLSQRGVFLGSLFGALVATFLAWILIGSQVWSVVALAFGASLVVWLLRPLLEVFNLSGRGRWRRWPPPRGTPLRLRRRWSVASKVVERGDERLAVEMLKELAEQAGEDAPLFAAALGRAALLEIELGRLQAASDHLDEISGRVGWGADATARVAMGMLALELGEADRAVGLLREALAELGSSSPLSPRATIALTEALARAGEPDEAIELVRDLRARPFAMRGLAGMLEAQVAVVMALLEAGREDRAGALLEDLEPLVDGASLPLGRSEARRLKRAEAHCQLLRGQLLLANSEMSAALRVLKDADDMAEAAGHESLHAAATALRGVALARSAKDGEGVSMIVAGTERLEARRLQLRVADRRSARIAADESLYTMALEGLFAAQEGGAPGAGIAAARLIESLRQSALAASLRSGPLPIDDDTRRLIAELQTSDGGDDEVEHLRARVGAQISARFASAYLPNMVTEAHLLAVARRFGHVLSFYVPPSGLPGWRVWVSPSGEARVDPIGGGADDGAVLLAEVAAEGRLPSRLLHTPHYAAVATWERLASALLPLGLRKALMRAGDDRPEPVLVVPDGPLSAIPWAALCVGGRPIVEGATLQVAPTLDLVAGAGVARPGRRVLAHVADAAAGELRDLRTGCQVHAVGGRDAFLAAADSGEFDGAYIGSHGGDRGLRQAVEFGDGSMLSAPGALSCAWPPWAVFGSCLVGRVEHAMGREPLGLAISCLLRGADAVVASTVELTDDGASVCGALGVDLAAGDDPPEALRAAQLAHCRRRRLSTVADGLGLVCITRGLASPQHSVP